MHPPSPCGLRRGKPALGAPASLPASRGVVRSRRQDAGAPRLALSSWIRSWFVAILTANLLGPATEAAFAAPHHDECVVLYPAQVRRIPTGLELEIHGIVYEPEQRRLLTRMMRRILGIDEEELTPAEAATFRERFGYFLVDNERGKTLFVQLGDQELKLGTSA